MSIIEKALDKARGNENGKAFQQAGAGFDAVPQAGSPRSSSDTTEGDRPSSGILKSPPTGEKVNVRPDSESWARRKIAIDWAALEAFGCLSTRTLNNARIREYRAIQRPLLMNAFPAPNHGIGRANLILVTSSIPGEGKTFTAINLAISIAIERNKTVLLIDAAMDNPTVGRVLGVPAGLGLTDLLSDPTVRFADVLVKTELEKFSVITAGNVRGSVDAVLASDGVRHLADELAARYPDRLVIFDAPALQRSAIAPALASLVGQTVLVVEAERTPQQWVQRSASTLSACEMVGCVLNKIRMDH